MEKLIEDLKKLVRGTVKKTIDERLKEFEVVPLEGMERVFQELCFCLLTANFNAEKSIKIQERIGEGFLSWPRDEVERVLREMGHRFPAARAEYIVNARPLARKIHEKVLEIRSRNDILGEKQLRDWLAKNVKGLGYKEASHFLRNIGFKNVAIIDFHILDLLERYNLVEKPKTLTRKRYLQIESFLEKIGKKARMSLAELDLYLWYMETGKVLK